MIYVNALRLRKTRKTSCCIGSQQFSYKKSWAIFSIFMTKLFIRDVLFTHIFNRWYFPYTNVYLWYLWQHFSSEIYFLQKFFICIVSLWNDISDSLPVGKLSSMIYVLVKALSSLEILISLYCSPYSLAAFLLMYDCVH